MATKWQERTKPKRCLLALEIFAAFCSSRIQACADDKIPIPCSFALLARLSSVFVVLFCPRHLQRSSFLSLALLCKLEIRLRVVPIFPQG